MSTIMLICYYVMMLKTLFGNNYDIYKVILKKDDVAFVGMEKWTELVNGQVTGGGKLKSKLKLKGNSSPLKRCKKSPAKACTCQWAVKEMIPCRHSFQDNEIKLVISEQ